MANYTIKYGETLLDVSMRLYSNVSYVFNLIKWNTFLNNINNTAISGLTIYYEPITKTDFKPVVTNEKVIQKNVTIRDFQSLFDVSLQIFGTTERAFEIVKKSSSENINDANTTGKVVEYFYENTKFPKYFLEKGIVISTKSPSVSTGFVIDENGNVIWDGLNELVF
jgi:hypothetical protein